QADRPPIWWWTTKAVRLGATEADDATEADIVLAGGGRAWVDGGPRTIFPDGTFGSVGVVHSETVEAGRLAPIPSPVAPSAVLAEDQLAAVAHGAGPARVLAPA